ncbi:hypothetical protein P4N68_09560 [Corynebacterium felinum]|uniref:Secreted protein n=1 Tax=Corynebacterium felinum TaxID=131318 RepID=A0ABU2BC36_9CORY|nr:MULTISPECIES: hypothetical protein [Corynebacterium]MDF5821322.1 hypothetical protein [Corynebacterium felinum]MDO4761458.1 hypothetical protein [Corynebacterium sp.]MDR7356160.1 hypothetical protein [Corynebacterium felinum]WJY95494.1 hypothetical protein CFELI_09450 [Corynebacterium felinum]
MKTKILLSALLICAYVGAAAFDFYPSFIAPLVCLTIAGVFFWPSRKK